MHNPYMFVNYIDKSPTNLVVMMETDEKVVVYKGERVEDNKAGNMVEEEMAEEEMVVEKMVVVLMVEENMAEEEMVVLMVEEEMVEEEMEVEKMVVVLMVDREKL